MKENGWEKGKSTWYENARKEGEGEWRERGKAGIKNMETPPDGCK